MLFFSYTLYLITISPPYVCVCVRERDRKRDVVISKRGCEKVREWESEKEMKEETKKDEKSVFETDSKQDISCIKANV